MSSSRHSVVVKVHEVSREVPLCQDGEQHEDCDGDDRVEKDGRLVEYLERAVAQERDVDVVAEGHHPHRVAQGGRRVPGPADDGVPEEELLVDDLNLSVAILLPFLFAGKNVVQRLIISP